MVKEDEATDPADISTFSAEAEMFYPDYTTYLIKEFWSWHRPDVSLRTECKRWLQVL